MSKKGENIYKRKDGRWEGRYIKCHDQNGKAYYEYVYAHSYKEVKEKLSKEKYHAPIIALFETGKDIKYCDLLNLWFKI